MLYWEQLPGIFGSAGHDIWTSNCRKDGAAVLWDCRAYHSSCRHRQLQIWWPALQVAAILPMLKRGIGIHHSGLLPILKEVIEIMFQEGLLKVGCLSA